MNMVSEKLQVTVAVLQKEPYGSSLTVAVPQVELHYLLDYPLIILRELVGRLFYINLSSGLPFHHSDCLLACHR
jgi:hypothetical protein